MKGVGCQSELIQLLVGDFDRGTVTVGVQGSFHDQARLGGGTGNQADHGLVAHQGLSAPVLGDEAEEAVFDSVPLAGARREVTDVQTQTQFVGQRLQRDLPQTRVSRARERTRTKKPAECRWIWSW